MTPHRRKDDPTEFQPSRRSLFQRPVSAKKTVGAIASAVLIPLGVALASWAANKYDVLKLDVDRFVADSSRREGLRLEDHALLQRIDARVGEMYCARIPAEQRGGCR